MHSFDAVNFNLKATLESGQIFRWEKLGEWCFLTAAAAIIKVKQVGNELVYGCSRDDFDVPAFFDLRNGSYGTVLESIGRSKAVAAAIRQHSGLRIMKQQPWECTASFICSSYSNIKRIKQNLNAVAQNYGEKISYGSYTAYSFPPAAAIARNPEKLEKCGLGYRAKYLASTARIVKDGFDFEKIRDSSYDYAKKRVMQLPGVGEKVADCILLFSLGFSDAFPVDVWVEKAMRSNYCSDQKLTPKKIAAYGRKKFGVHAGYAQQFLYHHARNSC